MKNIRDYFIGRLLGEDEIYNSRVTILFNIILLGALMTFGIGLMGFLIGTNETGARGIISGLVMLSLIYVVRWMRSISLVCHIIVILMTLTILSNIFLIFQRVDYSTLSIFFICGVFSFLFLGARWAIFHATIQLSGLLLVLWFELYGTKWTTLTPVPLQPFEQAISYIIIMVLILYTIWALQFSNEKFAEKLRARNKELLDAKEKAEEMNRLKTNFLANMSHEVRTPVNGIIGLANLIEQELDDVNLKEMVRMQKDSSAKLLNTIEGILELSRREAENEKVPLEDVDLKELIKESVTMLRPIAINKGITLDLRMNKENITCLATKAMLTQVFNNIIGNALKFTEEGSVTVSVSREGKTGTISIKDTGIGIGNEFLPNVFNSFEREEQINGARYEGAGLGLAISHKYITLIGGEIFVNSEKGKGSEFIVKTPVV